MDRQRRVFYFSLPSIPFLKGRKREIGVYAAGTLFAVGWWAFISSCILSSRAVPPPDSPYDTVPVHVRFPDWLPGLFATFGMIVVNLIDKQRLLSDDGSWSGSGALGGVAWKARLFLFLGFALMAGGLAGSITVLVIKYVLPDWQRQDVVWWGVSEVIQNVCIMLSASVLWIAQNTESEYEYNLAS